MNNEKHEIFNKNYSERINDKHEGKSDQKLSVSLLYWEHDCSKKGRVSESHMHSFWQIEIVNNGHILIKMLPESIVLNPGDIFLIPPSVLHSFYYIESGIDVWTIKFELHGIEKLYAGTIIKKSYETNILIESLLNILNNNPQLTSQSGFAVEYILAGIVHIQCKQSTDQLQYSIIVNKVKHFLEQNNEYGLTIDKIAKSIGYSKNYLASIFHKETGTTIKKMIDEERIKNAERMLKYSRFNISEIAYNLGFSDVFTFSRFFKRIKGKSPREYRKSVR